MAQLDDQQQAPPQAAPADGENTAFSEAFADRLNGKEKAPDGSAPSDQEPASARSQDAPHEAAPGSASGEAAAFDPWEGLTPEQKAHFERVQNSERSNRGRVGALTKKLQTFASQQAAPKPPEQQDEGAEERSEAKPSLQDRLKGVVEEYGDVVGPIAEILGEVQAQIDSIQKPAATMAEVDGDAVTLTKAYEVLERDHPDYLALSEDANFGKWLTSQDAKVIGLANSFDPTEVSLVLTKFKAERSAAYASQSGESGDKGTQDGTATDDKRRRQIEGSRAVTARGAPVAAGVPNDFSSAFKARVEAVKADAKS